MKLTLGIWKPKQLAEWFGIKSISNNKANKLKELANYCDFDDLGKKGVRITKIYADEYIGKTKTLVKKSFDEAWGDYSQPNTIKNAATYIYSKNEKQMNIQFTTVYRVTCEVKNEWYGTPKGPEGSRGRCYCVPVIKENGHIRALTEEEKQIRKKIFRQYYEHFEKTEGKDFDDIMIIRQDELRGLKKAYQNGEISKDEYIARAEVLNGVDDNGTWDLINSSFESALGKHCSLGLMLENRAWIEDDKGETI